MFLICRTNNSFTTTSLATRNRLLLYSFQITAVYFVHNSLMTVVIKRKLFEVIVKIDVDLLANCVFLRIVSFLSDSAWLRGLCLFGLTLCVVRISQLISYHLVTL